jgi:aspartate aminotransferase-like enzyme
MTTTAPPPAPHLMIPGPTPLPDVVRQAMGAPAMGHRSPEFKAVLQDVFPRLQSVFKTTSDVLLYTASGTGAGEAAIMNTCNSGDTVLALCCGVFSERWADVATSLGMVVEKLSVEPGEINTVETLQARLAADTDKRIKLVTMNHSETSTGVLNPVKDLVAAVRAHGALTLVDAVTSLCAADFDTDGWGIDMAFSGSQKGFMIPPGLSFLSVGPRAWEAHQSVKSPGYYFNFAKNKKAQADATTAYTPATHLILALQQALHLMEAEGLDAMVARHRRLQQMVRAGAGALGLELLVKNDAQASTAVTAIVPPTGLSVGDIRAGLKKQFGITVADGQKQLKGKIFRIGHLGYQSERDVLMTLAALEAVLKSLGHKVSPGAAVCAAQDVMAGRQPVGV